MFLIESLKFDLKMKTHCLDYLKNGIIINTKGLEKKYLKLKENDSAVSKKMIVHKNYSILSFLFQTNLRFWNGQSQLKSINIYITTEFQCCSFDATLT